MTSPWEAAAQRLRLAHALDGGTVRLWGSSGNHGVSVHPELVRYVGGYAGMGVLGGRSHDVAPEPEMAIATDIFLSPDLDLGWNAPYALLERGERATLADRASQLIGPEVRAAIDIVEPLVRSVVLSDSVLKTLSKDEWLREDALVELIESSLRVADAIDRSRDNVALRPDVVVHAAMFEELAAHYALRLLSCPLGVSGIVDGIQLQVFVAQPVTGWFLTPRPRGALHLRFYPGLAEKALQSACEAICSEVRGSDTVASVASHQLSLNDTDVGRARILLSLALETLLAARPPTTQGPFR